MIFILSVEQRIHVFMGGRREVVGEWHSLECAPAVAHKLMRYVDVDVTAHMTRMPASLPSFNNEFLDACQKY